MTNFNKEDFETVWNYIIDLYKRMKEDEVDAASTISPKIAIP